ncbi:hypothetical protein HK102_003633, partial [Quaeritorhiza haematococci]
MDPQKPQPALRSLSTYDPASLSNAICSLEKSSTNLDKIVLHCQEHYASGKGGGGGDSMRTISENGRYAEALKKTQEYALQGISALAYQMGEAAKALGEYMDVQIRELDVLGCEAEAAAQHFGLVTDIAGRTALMQNCTTVETKRTRKVVKVGAPPKESSRTDLKFDLNMYENVGVAPKPYVTTYTTANSQSQYHQSQHQQQQQRRTTSLGSSSVRSSASSLTLTPTGGMIPTIPEPPPQLSARRSLDAAASISTTMGHGLVKSSSQTSHRSLGRSSGHIADHSSGGGGWGGTGGDASDTASTIGRRMPREDASSRSLNEHHGGGGSGSDIRRSIGTESPGSQPQTPGKRAQLHAALSIKKNQGGPAGENTTAVAVDVNNSPYGFFNKFKRVG